MEEIYEPGLSMTSCWLLNSLTDSALFPRFKLSQSVYISFYLRARRKRYRKSRQPGGGILLLAPMI